MGFKPIGPWNEDPSDCQICWVLLFLIILSWVGQLI